MLFSLAAASALLSLALPVARSATIDVTVGGPGLLTYSPEFVTANVGDVVLFTFKQKNHTATQSTLATPCVKSDAGFDSGFMPVPDTNTAGPFPAAQFTVTDTKPVWVYCAQGTHCQSGMVFAINPTSPDQFTTFKNNAMGVTAASSTAAATSAAPTATASGTVTASAPATSSTSTDHQVVVGGTGKLYYTPANITAQPGDTITFTFQQKNHTITQSTFANPCRALTLTSTTGQVGFDSGFQPVADGATTFPTYTIQVNDTTPIWAYCKQTSHCGAGMVFAVNAVETGTNTFEAFQAKAMQLNGTGTSSSSAAGSSGTGTSGYGNGAINVRGGAGVAVALVAVAFGYLL